MSLLHELKWVDWQVAMKTYGNDHVTLIGLVVSWWNKQGEQYWSIDEGPTCGGPHPGGHGAHRCDALLCRGDKPLVVLDVEGNKYCDRIQNMQKFFQAETPEPLRALTAGILLAYVSKPTGRGNQRAFVNAPTDSLIEKCKEVINECPKKQIILIVLSKQYQRDVCDVRTIAEFYRGKVVKVEGFEVVAGKDVNSLVYAEL